MAIFAERMRVALAMIAHVQVVVEKLAGQHGGARRRRQAITYLETLKAISRLLLLACTREMVMGGGAVRKTHIFVALLRCSICLLAGVPSGSSTFWQWCLSAALSVLLAVPLFLLIVMLLRTPVM